MVHESFDDVQFYCFMEIILLSMCTERKKLKNSKAEILDLYSALLYRI